MVVFVRLNIDFEVLNGYPRLTFQFLVSNSENKMII